MFSNVEPSHLGFIRTNNGLRFIEDRNCIIRQEEQPSKATTKVKLIAGGRSGHDPAFRGYVGKGMLDATVYGDLFNPPTVRSIVDCLRMVAQPYESVLFIVNNYEADRLNFGLAVERARLWYGYGELGILLNNDDCASGGSAMRKSLSNRGLAGCVVLIKILGAMAEQGEPLDRLQQFGRNMLHGGYLTTVGWTFDVENDQFHNIELGTGLYGKPGVRKATSGKGFDPFLNFARDKINESIPVNDGKRVVVFVNNIGEASDFIMNMFLNAFFTMFSTYYNLSRTYVGKFFTSRIQSGISITMIDLQYNEKLLEYLDYQVQVASPLFKGVSPHTLPTSQILQFEDQQVSKVPIPAQKYRFCFSESTQLMIREILKSIANSLLRNRDLLNCCDSEFGPGNAGNIVAKGAEALLACLDLNLDWDHPAKLFNDISAILEQSIDGTTGATYGLLFQGISKTFMQVDNCLPKCIAKHWLVALTHGNDTILRYALATSRDRSILDVLRAAEAELRSLFQKTPTPHPLVIAEKFATACVKKANTIRNPAPPQASDATRKKKGKCVEPGAHAVGIWAWTLYEGFKDHAVLFLCW